MHSWKEQNYYDLLGVSRHAPREEIRKAFKTQAIKCHPEGKRETQIVEGSEAPQDHEFFTHLLHVYRTLIDGRRRAEYNNSIPGGIPSWDDARHNRSKNSKMDSAAYRQFGLGDHRLTPREEIDEEDSGIRSMKEEIERSRKFTGKFRALFAPPVESEKN